MADIKRFLDFPGLSEYDKLIKEYIKTGSTDEIEKIIGTLAEIAETDLSQDEDIALINTKLDVINGDDETEGSIDYKVKNAIDALVAEAPEAFDTLKEIAEWISDDESGAATLVSRVSANEEKIEELKEYVDVQDKAYFDAIVSIEDLKIASLFPVKQAAGVSAAAAIEALEAGKAIELIAEQTIEEDLVIDKSCFINANGSVFNGNVTVPVDVEVVIENAVFSKPVVVA